MTTIQDLRGRTALITGAGRGIGAAIAQRLEAAGAKIIALDLAAALEEAPAHWQRQEIDLNDPKAQENLTSFAKTLGVVDIVVANAGLVPPWRGVDELDFVEWQRVMNVNVWGAAITVGALAANLSQSKHASAIFMASINGYKSHPKQVLYTASKHAVVGVMHCAAQDLGPRGVRVNAIAPGPIATEALRARIELRHQQGGPSPQEAWKALSDQTMLKRVATAQDVANVAHFLASDASAAMTNHVFPVEAGLE